MKTRDLAREMRDASAAITRADIEDLAEFGVPPVEIEAFELVGLTRIARIPDTDFYEPDPSGAWAYITPVLVEDPATPESGCPERYARLGSLVDLIAWDPEFPRQWKLRA